MISLAILQKLFAVNFYNFFIRHRHLLTTSLQPIFYAACIQSTHHNEVFVTYLPWIAGGVACLLLLYLIYALIRAEEF